MLVWLATFGCYIAVSSFANGCLLLHRPQGGVDDTAYVVQNVGHLSRKVADFIGNDDKAASIISDTSSFYTSVESDNSVLRRDAAYSLEHHGRFASQRFAAFGNGLQVALLGDVGKRQHGAASFDRAEAYFENFPVFKVMVETTTLALFRPFPMVLNDISCLIR